MSNLDPHIFRAYDIRGEANTQLTEEACFLIGRAYGTELRERYNLEHPKVVVGRDARTHGPALEAEVIRGLMSTGCHILRMGQTPSPINYFTICTQELDGGVQVTASHNAAKDNGLKLQMREAEAYAGDDIQELRQRIIDERFIDDEGSEEEIDAITPYIEHVSQMFAGSGEGLHVVVDAGNGVAGPDYCAALRKIGCEVTELYTEPDGTFPNHPADPSKWDTLKELQETVKSTGADLGLGFDGDGDRIGLVDENGAIRSADDVLLLLAQDHLSRNPGAPVVFTVSNSGTLISEIEEWGGKPVMCKVGHSFVEHAMREHDSLLGGEQSGHFFCGEGYFGYDDALMASLRIIKIRKDADTPLSKLCAEFPSIVQSPELRPHCEDAKKGEVIAKIVKHFQSDYPVGTMDGARIDFGNDAWAGIRQSNTSPCLSICMEARTEEELDSVKEKVLGHVREYPEVTLD